MGSSSNNLLVATVDDLGLACEPFPAERVRRAQGLWRTVRHALRASGGLYLHEDPDTVVVSFVDLAAAKQVANDIDGELGNQLVLGPGIGITISLKQADSDDTAEIGRLLASRRTTGLSLCLSGQRWSIGSGSGRQMVTIGRDEGRDIQVYDQTSSREHARIEFRGDQFVLVDCSCKGTLLRDVSGERLVLGGEITLPRSGIICCSRAHFGQEYPEGIQFKPFDNDIMLD